MWDREIEVRSLQGKRWPRGFVYVTIDLLPTILTFLPMSSFYLQLKKLAGISIIALHRFDDYQSTNDYYPDYINRINFSN